MEFDIDKDGDYVMVPRATFDLMQAVMMAGLKPDIVDTIAGLGSKPDNFRVRVENHGAKKISLIKAIRDITGWALKEAKDFVDAPDIAEMKILGTLEDCEIWVGHVINVSPGAVFSINPVMPAPPPTKVITNNQGDPYVQTPQEVEDPDLYEPDPGN